ncbi:MAG: DUF1028 domain-containing protein [Candidatus Puniceispirillales bacterium]
MTFSIVGHCPKTGQFGMAVTSSSPAVAARCAYARAGVGAVASQNVTDPRLGPRTLEAMAGGMDAEAAVAHVMSGADHRDYRQVLAVDAEGRTAIFSGASTLGINAEYASQHAAAAGNLLDNTTIPEAMVTAFHETNGHLGDRLIAAMQAGLHAGGEAGDIHSAGMLLVDRHDWPLAELRCDWTEDCPIAAITAAWDVYKPQMDDYVTRALNPASAPSYGVPGDL